MANCSFPTCQSHAEENGYCVRHYIYAAKAKKGEKKKPRQRIPRKSKKLAKKGREYIKIVREMLAGNMYCELKTPDCTGVAEGLHHMKGRGIHLLNKKYLKRACNACNGYVERHPNFALENGHSVSRIQKES